MTGGTWSTQTPATYTLSGSSSSFTMSTSKGNCGVSSGQLTCGSGVSSSTFSSVSHDSAMQLYLCESAYHAYHRFLLEAICFLHSRAPLHSLVMPRQAVRRSKLSSLAAATPSTIPCRLFQLESGSLTLTNFTTRSCTYEIVM